MLVEKINKDGSTVRNFNDELKSGKLCAALAGTIGIYRLGRNYGELWRITLTEVERSETIGPLVSYTYNALLQEGGKGVFTVNEDERSITYKEEEV